MQRSSGYMGLAALDGSLSLLLTASAICFSHYSLTQCRALLSERVSLVDVGFGLTFIVLWQYMFSRFNLYDSLTHLPSKMAAVMKGVLFMLAPVSVHLLLFHRQLLDLRTLLYVFCALFAYEVDRIGFRGFILGKLSARNTQTVVIVGSGRRAAKAWREIRTRYHSSTNVLGFVDDRDPSEMAPDIASRYLGRIDDLEQLLLTKPVDVLLGAMPLQSSYQLMQRAVTIAESTGIRIIYLKDVYSTHYAREPLDRMLFEEFLPPTEWDLIGLAANRLMDILVSAIALLALSPMLVIGWLISMTLGVTLFSYEERLGYKRHAFRILRFRGASPHESEDQLFQHGLCSDTRESILRRTRSWSHSFYEALSSPLISQIPSLWNVLLGDMSLIGPQAPRQGDLFELSEKSLRLSFSVKPGLISSWQVQGRPALTLTQWTDPLGEHLERVRRNRQSGTLNTN